MDQDQQANLAQYKQFRADHLGAVAHFLKYLETDLYNGPMRAELAAYRPLLAALVNAQRAVEKANRLLERESALAGELVEWASPHLNNGGLPPVAEGRSPSWREAATLLNRARRWLLTMPEDKRAGVHARGGRFGIVWIEKDAPSYEELKALLRRVELVLGLADSEIARGDDKKEAPRCQR